MIKFLNKYLDKMAHESLSNVIAWTFFFVLTSICKSIGLFQVNPIFQIINSALTASVIAFSVGFVKEKRDTVFDNRDIIANLIGIFRFNLQILVISIIF